MPRVYQIRWKSSDEQLLNKTVKNFNAKIRRLEKKYDKAIEQAKTKEEARNILRQKEALPEKVVKKDLKALINTRKDLNREVKMLQRFSKKGAEQIKPAPNNDNNLLLTKWQIQEYSRRMGIINRNRNKRLKEIEELEATSRGEELGYTRGAIGMGSYETNILKPAKAWTKSLDRTGFNKKWGMSMEELQADYYDKGMEVLKNNYIDALLTEFNEEDIKDVVEAIRKMSYEDFYKIYHKEGGEFSHIYYPNVEAYEGYIQYHKRLWVGN